TIADFVADVRAPTPSAAAELVCPDLGAWSQRLDSGFLRLNSALQRQMQVALERCNGLQQRLERQHPRQRLQDGAQRIDAIESRLLRAANSQFDTARERHDQL